MMHRLVLILLSILFLGNNAVVIVNRRIVYYFNVSYAENSSSIVLINNQMPGPTIEAELNDIIVIHVTNYLPASERLAIHFHGMLVRQTPQMDGVPYITQMPIESQCSYTYVFRAHPAGTYFYHSHAGLQSVTAFGGVIVHDRRKVWNVSEVASGPLLFSDLWFQPDRLTQEHNLLASPFVWQGEPTYLLINGKRDFVLTLDFGKRYLLRLIGSTTLSTVVFGIDEHPMTVVEVDGTLVVPKPNVHSIELSSGQRYGVIIETNHPMRGIFLMQLAIRWRTLLNGSR
jgi:FtsP/CotA-like multicopper oxidase with cupredoxin domain